MTTATRLNDILATTAMADLPDLTVALAGLEPLPERLDRPLAVAEAAELLALSPHTLRYYERAGLVEVDRDAAGNRAYDMTALARVVFISRLRLSGMPIRTIANYITLVNQGQSTVPQRLAMLQRHRDDIRRQLHELQFALAVVDYKIVTYGGECSDGTAGRSVNAVQ